MGAALGLPSGGGVRFVLADGGRFPGFHRIFTPKRENLETVLIFRIGSLGDTIVALPCFHRIARSFPDARRILLTDVAVSRKVAPADVILADSGLIDDVIHLPPRPRRFGDLARLRKKIRQTGSRTL